MRFYRRRLQRAEEAGLHHLMNTMTPSLLDPDRHNLEAVYLPFMACRHLPRRRFRPARIS
jgi:hypothetical protein